MKWIEIRAIRSNVSVKNWEEAVEKTGELLVGAGFVEPGYINAMLETTKELGPYCVIAPGIAIPHARPDNGVKSNGYSAITLVKPVNFGNPDNDPVFLVIALSAINHNSHIETLSLIARKISVEGFIDRVKLATNDEELERILNDTESN
jgi:mannitol/fructose-specific phosphotransferase system IIA component (Ntr-type)